MNLPSILILIVVGVILIADVAYLCLRARNQKGGCDGCDGCNGCNLCKKRDKSDRR